MRNIVSRVLARFGYVKADPEAAYKLNAAAELAERWQHLAPSLPDDYECHMTCGEADSMADLLDAFGYIGAAEYLREVHADHDDDCDDVHHTPCDDCTEQPFVLVA
ncbi:hypothetical protein [Streptomyces sp. NPDC058861]|uniref:hypothetical protein n=1 Tax=Streptomyces sp. NPDC058861 TaxID=3346653 RepID=UPI0036B9938E